MLIKPHYSDEYINNDEDPQVLKFNTSKGHLKENRNTLYVKLVSNEIGQEIYDIILVSDMIKKYRNFEDLFTSFNFKMNESFNTGDLDYNKPAGMFAKIVHVFNGVYRGDHTLNIKQKLHKMSLYPIMSYSIGMEDVIYMPISKVLYIKHGTRTLSNVTYKHLVFPSGTYPEYSGSQKGFVNMLDDLVDYGCYIDITDPKYPDLHPYKVGVEYPRCLEIRSMYTGNEILSSLLNLTCYIVNDSEELRRKEYENEQRNSQLRRLMMSEDIGNANVFEMSEIKEHVGLRIMARNIAVDFAKVSVCSMLENVKIIYDSLKGIMIDNVRVPFEPIPTVMMAHMVGTLQSEFTSMVKEAIRDALKNESVCSEHVRISVYDTPYETVVQVTNFETNRSEVLRMNKSEILHDYLIEGIHHKEEDKVVIHRNMDLLTVN